MELQTAGGINPGMRFVDIVSVDIYLPEYAPTDYAKGIRGADPGDQYQ